MYADLFEQTGAVFSDCGMYRYRLDRIWNPSLPPLLFGMLNPSTADHVTNDATIERCQRRAHAMGFGSLIVWNLFAFRATKPRALMEQTDPIGPENNDYIAQALAESKARGGLVIVGWGTHGVYLQRHLAVLKIAGKMRTTLYCLGTTRNGHPKHPLYVSYAHQPSCWQIE